MKNKFLMVLAVASLAGPAVATAELVQAATSNILTFRDCTTGETTCDSIGPIKKSVYGGLPGEMAAEVSQADVDYGEVYGKAELTEEIGAATLKTIATSTPATRNGSTNMMLQRYTNTSESAETLTFAATMEYQQSVPAENATFPDEIRMRSGASAELVIFSMDVDAIEAGTTAEELNAVLFFEQEPAGLENLDGARVSPDDNATGEGEATLSTTALVEPGDSVWLFAILRGIVVNGATVNASMTTNLE